MLAFTLSLDDLVIASFTTGPGATTLPIRIYSEVRLGVKPEINAICTIMIAVVAIGVAAASLLAKFHEVGRGAHRQSGRARAAEPGQTGMTGRPAGLARVGAVLRAAAGRPGRADGGAP